jgi:hypothetical protein
LLEITAFWAFCVFFRMLRYQASMFLVVLAVAFALACVAFLVHAFLHIARHGKQPPEEEQQAAFQRISKPVFAAGWYGFMGSCIAAMIVIVEVNDPFSRDAMDRVVKDHSVLFWFVVAAGFVIGAGDHIRTMITRRNRKERAESVDRAESSE